MGVNFTGEGALNGPDLFRLARSVPSTSFADDVRPECLDGVAEVERARAGDWIAIWGGEWSLPQKCALS